MGHGRFVTVLNCIDGRVQFPVLKWMKDSLQADYVDSVTEPGADKVLSEGTLAEIERIKSKVLISTSGHHSKTVALVGHYDCAANPGPQEMHTRQINKGIDVIKNWGLGVRVLGLWVGENWDVECIYDSEEEKS